MANAAPVIAGMRRLGSHLTVIEENTMPEAVIVEAVRSPVGKRNGGLSGTHAAELSAQVLNGLVQRAGVDPALVDDVVWGCVMQAGEQALDIARTSVLTAGWPETVPGVTVDRQCGSSQQSVHFAAAGVTAGHYDVVVAGGVEVMSRTPMGSSLANGGKPYPAAFHSRYGQRPNQGIGAEMIAERWGFDRTMLDQFSLDSHEKAAAAQDSGAFDHQIVGIKVQDEEGNESIALRDEAIRRGTPIEKMAQLKPAFKEDGVIHAGNSSQISDGSAALLFMSAEKAKELGLKPIARVHTATLAGADPVIMLTAPIPATQKALNKSGLTIDEIGVFEVNEAFAPVPLAWLKDTGADEKKLNPNGGAIALGHPLGGSGARIMTTMLYHMRDNGIRYGLQTMCEGGGQANATILELL
jgi:acetyl-CoA acyltransferase